jgi:hypothetical protein
MTTKAKTALCGVVVVVLLTVALNVTYQLGYRQGSRDARRVYQVQTARLMTTEEAGAALRSKIVSQPNRNGNAIPLLTDNKLQSQ